jgi:hypothetical protein
MIVYYDLANLLLYHFIDGYGIRETIGFLYSRGYDKRQLLELRFNEKDIDEAIKFEEEL